MKGNRRTSAIVHVREGSALVAAGRPDEGEALLRAGLDALPAGDPSLADDRLSAAMSLAALAENRLDYADAATRYAAVERMATDPASRLFADAGQVRTATYIDPAAALAALGRADALAATSNAEPAVLAGLRRFHAELLLNTGDFAGAKKQAAAAVKLRGGLTTTKVSSLDVSIRSDYAIAALLTGDADGAREYLAMTGAGRMPNGVFGRGIDTPVPDCGGDAGLRPADLAVVEFTVADDGRTVGVRPVYAAGGGAVALTFASAVANWSWTPEQLTKVPLFFRNRVRLELRCSTAFARPSVATYLDTRLGRWLGEHDVEMPPIPTGSEAAALPQERQLVASAEAKHGKDGLALVPALHLILRNRVTPREERHATALRELALLERYQAPASVRLAVDAEAALSADDRERRKAEALQSLVPRYAGDPDASGALALMISEDLRGKTTTAAAMLRPVAENKALAPDNPIRTAALIRLASLEQRDGHADAARALYTEAAIPPESCALIDAAPQLVHFGGSFPMEAMRWGFEGWTMLQYDLSPTGKASGVRAVIAYPPFVFSKAGIEAVAGAQYTKTYRPDGQSGCSGATTNVRFMLPEH